MWITFLQGGRGIEYHYSNDMEKVIITKIIKTGNSLCIVIPSSILSAVGFKRGDQVVFGIIREDTIAIRKVTQQDILQIKPPLI